MRKLNQQDVFGKERSTHLDTIWLTKILFCRCFGKEAFTEQPHTIFKNRLLLRHHPTRPEHDRYVVTDPVREE